MRKLILQGMVLTLAAAFSLSVYGQSKESAPPASVDSKGVATTTGTAPGGESAPPASVDSKGVATTTGSAPVADDVGTLQIDEGVIMVSESGHAFVSGTQDQHLTGDSRLMVAKDSKARVVFADGCETTYDQPGVYQIRRTCGTIAGAANVSPGMAVAGIIAAGGLASLLIADGRDGDPPSPPDPPPVSR